MHGSTSRRRAGIPEGEGEHSIINFLSMLKLNIAGLIYITLALTTTAIADTDIFRGGHAKYFFLLNTFPDDSLFLDYIDSPTVDHKGDLRLKFGWQKNKLEIAADYQLIAAHGDGFELANSLPGNVLISDPVPTDKYRLFDLTSVITENSDSALLQRLDRLYVGVTGKRAVLRIGRQAVSWGNGLIYTPMDFFNPFDPAAVDKEYKTGDDMIYGQYLTQSGDDMQAVWVLRRDLNGNVSSDVDSIAAKYHGFAGDKEYDLLIAQHYDDNVLAFGGLSDLGTALWRGDITITRTSNNQAQTDNIFSLVTSITYSWVGWNRNISGVAEYFYNGFGQADGDYSPAALAANPDLVERLVRGELFTLGRHYLALSAMIEMTPLWSLTPNAFINIGDGSFLAQLVTGYDLKQDLQILAALNVPVGASDTEYGGIDSGISGKQLSTGPGIFAQLAWYF